MPLTYQFITPPEYDYEVSKVILTFEDFYKIMDLAQKQLNAQVPHFDAGDTAAENRTPQFERTAVANSKEVPKDTNFSNALKIQQAQIIASFTNALSHIQQSSHILNSTEGRKLGNHPLQCLSTKLSHFMSATQIFSTRSLAPKTEVAKEFHTACDNVPNVLVIIKSGQYIAGGFAAVAFESGAGDFKPDPTFGTFVFSLNRQKVYPLKREDKAVLCHTNSGPLFGCEDILIRNDFTQCDNFEYLHTSMSSFDNTNTVKGELFGDKQFAVDEYEVFRLSEPTARSCGLI